MNPTIWKTFAIIIAFAGGLLLGDPARAAVTTTINSPGSSFSLISFIDTNSLSPSLVPGGGYNQFVSPWGGPAPISNTLPLTIDPIGDFAKGNITANVTLGNYSLALNSVVLNQAPLNTGFADLIFTFSVEFQLDAAGLPSQATVYPNFNINGTIQNAAGSFAAVKGYINYTGVNTAGTISLLDTVNYNFFYNTPGNFSATVVGVPNSGTTPTLAPNTTLTLSGMIDFTVDPANINVETAPEPSTIGLVVVGLLGVVGLRRRTA